MTDKEESWTVPYGIMCSPTADRQECVSDPRTLEWFPAHQLQSALKVIYKTWTYARGEGLRYNKITFSIIWLWLSMERKKLYISARFAVKYLRVGWVKTTTEMSAKNNYFHLKRLWAWYSWKHFEAFTWKHFDASPGPTRKKPASASSAGVATPFLLLCGQPVTKLPKVFFL